MTHRDTQSFHGGIVEIERLSRVGRDGARTNAQDLYYSPQRYDTPANQKRALARLPGHIAAALRARSEQGNALAQARQLRRLARLVDHAYLNVPFYRRLYRETGYEPGGIRSLQDFACLPTVTRRLLNTVSMEERLSAGRADRLYSSRTSGSSGAPLEVRYDDRQVMASMCNYLLQVELATGKPVDPDRWLYNIHHARWWLPMLDGRYRTFSVNELPPAEALDRHLRLLRPQVLITLPSFLEAMAAADLDLQSIGIEAILTNSEQGSPEERRRFERRFRVPVRDEYSSVELEQIAFECGHGAYHVLERDTFVEVVHRDSEGVGNVVGTNLNAWRMPMIRYNQGDLAQPLDRCCPCGAHGAALARLHGRQNASFDNRQGQRIPSASLLGVLDDFLTRADCGARDYRLSQLTEDVLVLQVVGAPAFDHRPLHGQLERLFGHEVTLTLEHCTALPPLPGYKRQILVSHLSSTRGNTP